MRAATGGAMCGWGLPNGLAILAQSLRSLCLGLAQPVAAVNKLKYPAARVTILASQ
jgi:hypothetical protein